MKVVFMGTPEWSVPTLKVLLEDSSLEVCTVYTQPDKPVGRKKIMQASPVKEVALQHGVRVICPHSFKKQLELVEELEAMQPDFTVVCAFGQILPQRVLDAARLGSFNSHFSFLPRWRGASPIQAAIREGDTSTGISIQRMVMKLDAGAVVAQSDPVPILPEDTTATLGNRLSLLAADVLKSFLVQLKNDSLTFTEQEESQVTFCSIIKKTDGLINWQTEGAEAIERKCRAYTPWPGIYTWDKEGRRLQLTRVQVESNSHLTPGKVNEGFVVGTSQGGLRVLMLKPEGKREMNAEEFLRGNAHVINSVFGNE